MHASFFARSRLLVRCSLVVYLTSWGLFYGPCCHSPLPVAFLSLRLRLCLSAWGRFEDSTACTHSGRCGAPFAFADIRVVGSRDLPGGEGGRRCGSLRREFFDGDLPILEAKPWLSQAEKSMPFYISYLDGRPRGRKRLRDNYCVS